MSPLHPGIVPAPRSVDPGAQQAADRAYREGQMFLGLREAVELLEDNGGRGFVDDLGGMDLRHGEKCDCWRHKVARFLARLNAEKKEGT